MHPQLTRSGSSSSSGGGVISITGSTWRRLADVVGGGRRSSSPSSSLRGSPTRVFRRPSARHRRPKPSELDRGKSPRSFRVDPARFSAPPRRPMSRFVCHIVRAARDDVTHLARRAARQCAVRHVHIDLRRDSVSLANCSR